MSEALLGAWWQVLAVAATAIVASIIALWGVMSQRAISRRGMTMSHMAVTDNDTDMIAARRKFIKLAKKPGGLTVWADLGSEHCQQCEAIRLVLNDFELIACGIQLGVIDLEFYRRYNRGTVIRYWYAAAPFIYSLRAQTGSKTIYHEFEQLFRIMEIDPAPKRSWLFLKLK
jgi:hypothetical protein